MKTVDKNMQISAMLDNTEGYVGGCDIKRLRSKYLIRADTIVTGEATPSITVKVYRKERKLHAVLPSNIRQFIDWVVWRQEDLPADAHWIPVILD